MKGVRLTGARKRHREDLVERLERERGTICEICRKRRYDHLHHKIYDNYGFEKPEDICLLCEKCHKELHVRARAWELTKKDIPFVNPAWADDIHNRVQPEYIKRTYTNEAGLTYLMKERNPRYGTRPSLFKRALSRLFRR